METSNVNESGTKRKALGKGLEELFNSEFFDYNKVEEKIVNETPKEEIINVKISELRSNPYQPRKIFDEKALEELSQSIKEHGIFQPIIIKQSIKGYEIIAGERRVKASEMAGLKEIPAIIRNFNDTQMMEIALLENLQRENLTAIEEAQAYQKLQETLTLTQEELAKRIGKSRSHVTNMLGLLNLPKNIQDDLNSKKITMGHARVLSKLEDIEQQQFLENKIINEGISVRKLEELTQEPIIAKANPQKPRKKENNEYDYLQEAMSEKLGTKVKVKKNSIEISFSNEKDLNRILEIMNIGVDK